MLTKRRSWAALVLLALGAAVWIGGWNASVPAAVAKGRPHVFVYMTAWCRACQTHMRGLDRKSIPYRAIDIEKDPAPYRPVREKLGRSTIPVTIVKSGGDQRWIIGANSDGVERAYHEMSD